MTKEHEKKEDQAEIREAEGTPASRHEEIRRIAELEDENLRLRRLVVDLLLQKLEIQESLSSPR